MKILIDFLRDPRVEVRKCAEFLDRGRPYALHAAVLPEQRFSPHGTDTRNVIQHRVHLRLRAEAPVVLDGKAVRLVLNAGDELKALASLRNRKFPSREPDTPRPVSVVLDHAADRNL